MSSSINLVTNNSMFDNFQVFAMVLSPFNFEAISYCIMGAEKEERNPRLWSVA